MKLGQPRPESVRQKPTDDVGDEPVRMIENRRLILSMIAIDNGSRLVAGGDERSVIVWDTETAEQVKTFSGHQSIVMGVWASDSSNLVSIDQKYQIKSWQLGAVVPVGLQNEIPIEEVRAARDITTMGETQKTAREAAQRLRQAENGDA